MKAHCAHVYCAYTDLVPTDELVPHPLNPNKHPKLQIERLAKIIAQGWRNPITVSRRSKFIIKGHARLEAAKLLSFTHVPVDYQEYENEAQEWADMVADNKIAELSELDDELTARLLQEMPADFDPEFFGLSMQEATELLAGLNAAEVKEDNFDLNKALEQAKANPITKLGDLWVLGNHRLFCGDCLQPDSYARLMQGKQAAMVFTDPPYNVDYESSSGQKIQNDHLPAAEFNSFLQESFKMLFDNVQAGGAVYVCHADSAAADFRTSFQQAGWLLKQCLIWVKNHFTLGRQDYQWRHEPILYGWKPGTHKWYGKRNKNTVLDDLHDITISPQEDEHVISVRVGVETVHFKVPAYEILEQGETTVWHVDKPLKNEQHPTMKPLKLCARAINNSSMPKEIVLDSFCGSGSTLLACEQIGRACYGMELEPIFCDVIVQRWEEFTKEKAILETL